jgi:hypothetical protein
MATPQGWGFGSISFQTKEQNCLLLIWSVFSFLFLLGVKKQLIILAIEKGCVVV